MNAIKWTEKKHVQFARAMKRAGREVISYSGRGMYGAICPAVVVDACEETTIRRATRVDLAIDSMGRGIVLYAR